MQITEIQLLNSATLVYAEEQSTYKVKTKVVVEINGSTEIGVINGTKSNNNVSDFVDIIREATPDDMKTNCENCKYARSLLPEIKQEAQKLNLDMKISLITTNLERNKIFVFYTAEERVDFRELIKILASKYKARIEMKQIGNRDETKAIGALGVCGLQTCCKGFLNDFDKVSIKMAKNQNISLNPSKINGMCGRLLCCLKYEDEYYADMQKKMPKLNSYVTTPDGKGTVTATDFLKEKVTVTFTKDDTTENKIYDLKDITFGKKSDDNK